MSSGNLLVDAERVEGVEEVFFSLFLFASAKAAEFERLPSLPDIDAAVLPPLISTLWDIKVHNHEAVRGGYILFSLYNDFCGIAWGNTIG